MKVFMLRINEVKGYCFLIFCIGDIYFFGEEIVYDDYCFSVWDV